MLTMHPGEYLEMAYLEPLQLSQKKLSDMLGVSPAAISRLVSGNSDLSPEMAVRLSLSFDRSAESWMQMQMQHSLQIAKTAVDPTTIVRRVQPACAAE